MEVGIGENGGCEQQATGCCGCDAWTSGHGEDLLEDLELNSSDRDSKLRACYL
jgi:hypothetical protein